TFGPTAGSVTLLPAAGLAGLSSSEGGGNPLTPFYNAVALSQVLGNPTPAGSGGSNTSSRNTGSDAAPLTGTSSTTDPASGPSLPSVRNALGDAATGLHSLLLVGNVSPPPLDIQDPGTTLPPVHASDQVHQAAATDNQDGTVAATAVTLAIPEPGPLVLL